MTFIFHNLNHSDSAKRIFNQHPVDMHTVNFLWKYSIYISILLLYARIVRNVIHT